MGNRIAKHVITTAETASTYYTLDAQGNQMSVYTYSTDNNNLYLAERNIYGSSRIGQEQLQKKMVLNQIANNPNYHTNLVLGNKRYELSNHLGNVLNVVTDRKLANNGGSGSVVAFYTADVVSFSDYDPFGMLMPNRHASSSDYRYGFQGQESD